DLELNIGSMRQTLSISGSISGSGSLTKNGAGLLELSGSNSYTGDTIVNDGFISVFSSRALGAATNSLILNSGTVFTQIAINGSRNLIVTPAGGTFTATADCTFGNLTVGTNSVAVSTFHKDGSGRLLVNSMRGGAVSIDAGQIRINGTRDNSRTSVLNVLSI